MSPQHPPSTETCSRGVSTTGEGGRGLLPARGSVPEGTSTHSQQPHVCQNDAGAKWVPLGGGCGGAAKALAGEACLLRGFSHTTLPRTALTSGTAPAAGLGFPVTLRQHEGSEATRWR